MTKDNTERLNEIELEYVHYMPKKLEHGILYVSKEFGCAQHLCACGCNNKVHTPIDGAYKWDFTDNEGKATLHPSIGSFQIPCKSHYIIKDGKINWCK